MPESCAAQVAQAPPGELRSRVNSPPVFLRAGALRWRHQSIHEVFRSGPPRRGDGSDAWLTHYEALAARDRGEPVVILSVGDPDLETPAPVIDRAVQAMRTGDTHYVQAGGRPALRAAIARRHTWRTGQVVEPGQVIVLAGAQNALFVVLDVPGWARGRSHLLRADLPTYPATIEASGAQLVRAARVLLRLSARSGRP